MGWRTIAWSGRATTFAPASDIPVPSNYVIGPGDTIELQLIGDSAGFYPLVVGRERIEQSEQMLPQCLAYVSPASTDRVQQRSERGIDVPLQELEIGQRRQRLDVIGI